MILKIKKHPELILRKKSEEITEITAELKDLAKEMEKFMIAQDGVGLAAPQIGIAKRLIVVRLIKERSPEERAKESAQIFINPRITKKSRETIVEEEGCLSLPALFLKIKRAKWVELVALDIEGKEVCFRAEGLPARIFQHEIDHLDGILILDRIPFWQRWKIRRKLIKLSP